MPTLPLLKSGQLAQYPIRRTLHSYVETVSFLDGSEQRCARSRPLHQWAIQLDLIDEQEFAALESFIQLQQGEVGQFEFTDPADQAHYPNCSFELDVLDETFEGPGRVRTMLIVRENPN
jgi:hypothetical protein